MILTVNCIFLLLQSHKFTNSCVPLLPSFFKNSAGMSSTPTALFSLISFIALITSSFNNPAPISSLSTSSLSSISISSLAGFPFLSYSASTYSFHLLFIFSSSVSNTPLPSLIDFFPLLLLLLPDNSATFEYKTSVSPRLPSSSISLHSLSHHASLALFVSLLSSLFKLLYICLPTSVFTFLYLLLSSILSRISFVIHGFLVVVLVWYPTTVFAA